MNILKEAKCNSLIGHFNKFLKSVFAKPNFSKSGEEGEGEKNQFQSVVCISELNDLSSA